MAGLCSSTEAAGEDLLSCFVQALEVAHLPRLVALLPSSHHTAATLVLVTASLTPHFPFSLTRALVITLGPPGNPEYSPHVKIVNLIPSVKSPLLRKVTYSQALWIRTWTPSGGHYSA